MIAPQLRLQNPPLEGFVYALFLPTDRRLPGRCERGQGTIDVPAGFTGECVLFARDRGVLRLDWSDGATSAAVRLPDLVRLPLQAWSSDPAEEEAIRDDVANLNFLLNGLNPGGIVFDLAEVSSVPPAAWQEIGYQCGQEAQVRRSGYFQDGAVNVYYHPFPEVSARSCDDGRINFIGRAGTLGKLAHEIGHALGLRGKDLSGYNFDDGHPDALAPFTPENVMWRANPLLRHHFTLGQIYWMHASRESVLNQITSAGKPADCLEIRSADWVDEYSDRWPEAVARTPAEVESALARRYEAIVQYWNRGARQEGHAGSQSPEDFVARHLGREDANTGYALWSGHIGRGLRH